MLVSAVGPVGGHGRESAVRRCRWDSRGRRPGAEDRQLSKLDDLMVPITPPVCLHPSGVVAWISSRRSRGHLPGARSDRRGEMD